MSQEGIIDIIGTHPEIPTEFIANVGTAIPIANQLELLGEVVAAGTNPFRSIASGNTVTYQVQFSQAIASTNATNVGVAAFNSSDFSVDANGFVSLSASAGGTNFEVDAFTAPGTNPVVPDGSNLVTVTGGQVAAGTTANVIRTNSLAANTYTIQIQRSSAQSASTVGANGVSHFDTSGFGVDANGFVTLQGSALGVLTVSGTANRITSTGGQNPVIDIAATYVGQTSITTLGTIATGVWQGTTVAVGFGGTGAASFNVNGVVVSNTTTTGALASLTLTNGQMVIGSTGTTPVAGTITSTDGSVTVTTGAGTLNLAVAGGTTVGKTITGNSGGALSPTAGNWNILGTGSITTSGSGSTLTAQLTGLTNHAIQIGAGTATLTQLAAGTTGQILQTNTAADPTWSTATYPSTATSTGTILRADGTNWVATTATYPNTTTINQLLYSSSANTITGLATANKGVLTTGATGIPVITALATDGQLIIGSTAGVPAAATLSAGTGISITNGSNSISIAVSGSVVGQTITGDTGGALSPTAGNWNLLGSGSITTSGSGSTLTTQLTGLTNHNVLVGAGTSTITKVAPSATSGVPLISQGAAADPVFGTAVVAGGGTGATSFTANGAVISNTTTTGALAAVALASQQFLVGTSGAPTAKSLSINIQRFTASGTYTPTTGMIYCIIECVGGGGGGGGSASAAVNVYATGGGGGGGAYSRKFASSATVGASQTVTVGAAGTAGTAGNNAGGNGGTTSVGTICTANGGSGGAGNPGTNGSIALGGAGGTAGTGDLSVPGQQGQNTFNGQTYPDPQGGGGSSLFGYGGTAPVYSSAGQIAGQLYGGGGSGGFNISAGGNVAGAAGAAGIVIITEFVIA